MSLLSQIKKNGKILCAALAMTVAVSVAAPIAKAFASSEQQPEQKTKTQKHLRVPDLGVVPVFKGGAIDVKLTVDFDTNGKPEKSVVEMKNPRFGYKTIYSETATEDNVMLRADFYTGGKKKTFEVNLFGTPNPTVDGKPTSNPMECMVFNDVFPMFQLIQKHMMIEMKKHPDTAFVQTKDGSVFAVRNDGKVPVVSNKLGLC